MIRRREDWDEEPEPAEEPDHEDQERHGWEQV